jgi:hypothetical protein
MGARVPLLEAVAELGIAASLLRRIPADGVNREDLHARLDATRFATVAEFADSTWGQTDLAFLDFDDEMEVADADWSVGLLGRLIILLLFDPRADPGLADPVCAN